jgi:Family of unknown function (DUF6339)
MKLRFLKERALEELRRSVKENLARYRNGEFDYLSSDPSLSFESGVDVDVSALSELKPPKGAELFESENCAIFLAALKKLTPYEAADERLWTMLSHTAMLEHGRARWPIPTKDDDAVSHIETHFFAPTQRALERDNVASRLWWMGHLCARIEGLSIQDGLDALLHRADVRANIVERPTTGQSIPVFSAILRKLANLRVDSGR